MADDDLLLAIEAAPDDDAPRLVYADALIARGDPRGELIQVQCALARRDDPKLARKERELLASYGKEWAPCLDAPGVGVAFRRGFVDTLTFPSIGDYFQQLEWVRSLRPKPAIAFPKEANIHFGRGGELLLQVTADSAGGQTFWTWIDVWDARSGELISHLEREGMHEVRFTDDGAGLVLSNGERLKLP